MRRGGGRRGNGGHGGQGGGGAAAGIPDAGLQAMRQFVLSVIGGAGGAGGGGGAGGARRGTSVSRAREGEWPCSCGLSNRPYREQCHACGRPRPASGAHRMGGGGGKGGGTPTSGGGGKAADGAKGKGARGGGRDGNVGGPVGADGRRPLLGRWGDGAPSPLARAELKGGHAPGKGAAATGPMASSGKGPGLAAPMGSGDQRRAECGGGKPSADGDGSAAWGPKGAWTRPPPTFDAAGFQLVQPRRVWQCTQHQEQPGPGGASGGGQQLQSHQAAMQPQQVGGADTVMDSRPRWSDADSDDGMYAEDDLEEGDHADDGHRDDDEPDPQRLRSIFEAHARAVRDLEKRSKADGGVEDPALRTLRDARDEAERVWRNAKAPVPLSVRMGRAQAKLEKATAAVSKARYAIEEFDEWVDQRRAELVQKAEEARQWYLWRDQQMDALHAEAAEKNNGKTNGGGGLGGRGVDMSGRIIGDWLPQVQALLEHVQGNPEIEERLSALAAGMQDAGQELQQTKGDSAECFDIGDGEAETWGCAGGGPGSNAPAAAGNTKGGTTAWRPEGTGRWARADTAREARRTDGTDSIGGAASAAAEATAATAPGNASAGNKRGADEPADDDAKSAVRQKTEAEAREEADRRKAAELLQQQGAAIAAQQASHEAGEGGFGSQAAQSAAAQQFLKDVCTAVERARHLGIEPKADGKELVELSPMELTQWVSKHLDG